MKQNRNTTPRKFPTMFEHYPNAVAETIALMARLDKEDFDLKKCVEWLDGNTIREFQIGIPVGTPVAILRTPTPGNLDPFRTPWIEYGRIAEYTDANADMCGLECGTPSHRYAVYIERFWIGDNGTPESAGVCDYKPWEILRILTEGQWNTLLSLGLPYDPRDFTAAILDAERGTTKAKQPTATRKRNATGKRPALRVITKARAA